MKLPPRIENPLIDSLTPLHVRYLHPVSPRRATGALASLYGQIREDFQLVAPLTLHSQQPHLLAGVWALVRESQLVADRVPRDRKEALAAAVSSTNACPYCIDAHLGMLAATMPQDDGSDPVGAILARNTAAIGDPQTQALVAWGLACRTPGAEPLRNPPFTAETAPEVLGTALVYHYINRMAHVFLPGSPLPLKLPGARLRRWGIGMFGVMAEGIAGKEPRAGASAALLPPAELPDAFAWARPSAHVAAAVAGFAAAMEQAGEALPATPRQWLTLQLAAWQGQTVPVAALNAAVADLDAEHRAAARLLWLTAFAPDRVDRAVITAFRQQDASDTGLLAATAWASYAAAKRALHWLGP